MSILRLGAPLLALVLTAACAHDSRGQRSGQLAPGGSPNSQLASRFEWPLQGRVSSPFGTRRSHGVHRGIYVRIPVGTPIHVAAPGRVVFSGRQRGYGRVVIVEHAGGFETRYAHNQRNRVREGQRVGRGDRIADSGASGNASAPHLHFEVRKAGRALDPLGYLPSHPTIAHR